MRQKTPVNGPSYPLAKPLKPDFSCSLPHSAAYDADLHDPTFADSRRV
jgi:hypothetical protein